MLSRLRLQQPPTRKPVIELAVAARSAAGSPAAELARVRAPAAVRCVIFYWNTPARIPFTRVHEFVHVEQDAAHPLFFVFWVKYLAQQLAAGYRGNRFERPPARSNMTRASTACPNGRA